MNLTKCSILIRSPFIEKINHNTVKEVSENIWSYLNSLAKDFVTIVWVPLVESDAGRAGSSEWEVRTVSDLRGIGETQLSAKFKTCDGSQLTSWASFEILTVFCDHILFLFHVVVKDEEFWAESRKLHLKWILCFINNICWWLSKVLKMEKTANKPKAWVTIWVGNFTTQHLSI